MATQRKSLLDLPLEIVHNISDELRNPKDLLALGLTHRRFTHVAARARELTLLPVSPFTILVPPFPSISPALSSVISSAAVNVISSPIPSVDPSATTSASSSSTPIPSSGPAENQDYAQEVKEESQEDQMLGQVQAAAEVEEELAPDNVINIFLQALTQLRELRSLRIGHCTLPQEFRDEHFMLVKQMLTSISSAAHFDTLEVWDRAYTPELQWSRMPLLPASNIACISLDFTMKDVRATFPPQFMHRFLVKSCPMLQKLEIRVPSGSLNFLKPVLFRTWSQLSHLTLFEKNAMTLEEDGPVQFKLQQFLWRHTGLRHLFLSISSAFLIFTFPFNSSLRLLSFAIHFELYSQNDHMLLPNAAAPSTIRHLICPYTRDMNKRQIIGQFQGLESFEGEVNLVNLADLLNLLPTTLRRLDLILTDPLAWEKNNVSNSISSNLEDTDS
ncbi:hypothetical protein M422DRAFT_238681 [Sphaerobolus stellatus SS14]|nr:hypothetical protein M422DRAFT_238680 [Sphaerobolus stellatus SS14]KIJ57112.1 hypothetical protein M422DRAFT_238681 [Sphaerobolus stellatus SS14]